MLEAWALVALIRRNGVGEAGPDRHSRVRPVGETEAAGKTVSTRDTLKSMGLSRGAAALGVGVALGGIIRDSLDAWAMQGGFGHAQWAGDAWRRAQHDFDIGSAADATAAVAGQVIDRVFHGYVGWLSIRLKSCLISDLPRTHPTDPRWIQNRILKIIKNEQLAHHKS